MITVYSNIIEYLNDWNSLLPAADGTHEKRARYINKHIAPCLGDIRLNQYKQEHPTQLSQYLFNDPNTTEDVAFSVLRTFRQAMNHAQEIMLIRDSFCDSLYLPYKSNPAIRVYSSQEISDIFDVLDHDEIGNFFKLIYYAGLLRSEARGIRISDIDIPGRTLHIRQRLFGHYFNEQHTTVLENRQHIRDIYLSDRAMTVVLNELERHKMKKEKSYCKDNGEDILFINKNGHPITHACIQQATRVIQNLTGISDFSAHSLRYSAADAALKAGASEKDVQDYFGYLNLSNIYSLKSKFYCEDYYDNQCMRRINPIYL